MRKLYLLFLLVLVSQCTVKEDESIENPSLKTSDDLPVSNFYSVNQANFQHASLSKLENSKELDELLNYFKSSDASLKDSFNKATHEGYNIDTSTIKEIRKKGYISYTMRIERNDPKGFFENLMIENKNGIKKAYIISYIPNDEWMTAYLNNHDISFKGTINIEEVGIDGHNNTTLNKSSGSDCTTINIYIETACPCAGHWPGQSCTCSTGPSSELYPITSCSSGGGGSGSTDDGSGTGGGGSSTDPGDGDGSHTSLINPDGTNASLQALTNLISLSANEVQWLTDNDSNNRLTNSILAFIHDNDYSNEAKQFGKQAVQTWMNQGEVDFEEQIIIDPTFSNNKCLKNVYNKFKEGNNTISEYIANFIPNGSAANLTLKTDDNFQSNQSSKYWTAGAITSQPDNYMITITFNTDPNLSSSAQNFPSIILAVEFMHEMIHAEMYRKILAHAQQPNIPWTTQFIHSLRNDFEGLADYYTRWWLELPPEQEPTSAQHQLMAQHYINIMSDALSDYDDNQNSQDFYEALAWIGLKDTVAWDDPATDQSSINTHIQNALQNAPCN